MQQEVVPMPSLQVRDLPAHIHERLRRDAHASHRSLAGQAIAILERGLGLREDAKARRRRVLTEIDRTAVSVASRLSDPVNLVRQDRKR
jgi:hypothetical protein